MNTRKITARLNGALQTGDTDGMQTAVGEILESFHSPSLTEDKVCRLMIVIMLLRPPRAARNKEAEERSFDICLATEDGSMPGILIRLRLEKDLPDGRLGELADQLAQNRDADCTEEREGRDGKAKSERREAPLRALARAERAYRQLTLPAIVVQYMGIWYFDNRI